MFIMVPYSEIMCKKGLNITETNVMVIDWNFWCILSILAIIVSPVLLLFFFPPGGVVEATSIFGGAAILSSAAATSLFWGLTFEGFAFEGLGTAHACFNFM